MDRESPEMIRRRLREQVTQRQAQAQDKAITYIDTDGCEVSVSPDGHVFYNAADWW